MLGRIGLAVVLAVAGAASAAGSGSTPTIDLRLQASWSASSFIYEIIEGLAAENRTAVFPFLDSIVDKAKKLSTSPDRQAYDAALKVIKDNGLISNPYAESFLEASAASRIYAPAVEAYHHLYEQTILPEFREVGSKKCSIWVDVQGKQACDLAELDSLISKPLENLSVRLFEFDHVRHFGSEGTLILYADLSDAQFPSFHKRLTELSENGYTYVIRWKPSHSVTGPLVLSGYGAELALKSTDYLVVDDREVEDLSHMGGQKASKLSRNSEWDNLFQADVPKIEPVASNLVKDLGIKASSFIMQNAQSLKALTHLSQDFPKYAQHVAEYPVNDALVSELEVNMPKMHEPGWNALWINGMKLEIGEIDPYSILRLLRHEQKAMLSLHAIGLTPSQARDFVIAVTNKGRAPGQTGMDEANGYDDLGLQSFMTEEIYDVRDKSNERDVILWWNDLEKDKRYAEWPSKIYDLLRPVYPGQMRTLKKNLFHMLHIGDLSRVETLDIILDDMSGWIKQQIPLRMGMVPFTGSAEGTAIAKVVKYLLDEYGRATAMQYLAELHGHIGPEGMVSLQVAKRSYDGLSIVKSPKSGGPHQTFDDILAGSDDYIERLDTYVRELGFTPGDSGLLFLNGKLVQRESNGEYQQNLFQQLGEQTQLLQLMVYQGKVNDHTNVWNHLLQQSYVKPRYNVHLTSKDGVQRKYFDLLNANSGATPLPTMRYVSQDGTALTPVTFWVVADLDTADGLQLVKNALGHVQATNISRAAIIHLPSKKTQESKPKGWAQTAYDLLYEADPKVAKVDVILDLLHEFDLEQTPSSEIQKRIRKQLKVKRNADLEGDNWRPYQQGAMKGGIEPGFQGVIVNNALIGPIMDANLFTEKDFALAAQLEQQRLINAIVKSFSAVGFKRTLTADHILQASAIISSLSSNNVPANMFEPDVDMARSAFGKSLQRNHSGFAIGDEATALYHFVAIIDPLSEAAQKWAPLLDAFSRIKGAYVEIFLNPDTSLKEIPLKRFYRYVFDTVPQFDADDALIQPSAYFANIPEDPLLTLGLDVIAPWHTSPKASTQDLDNIRLSSLDPQTRKEGITAVYELEHILLEGHCLDITTKGPPRGAQFVLGTPSNKHMEDTIVMANLGYLQLKANPGVWDLALRPGRSQDVFTVDNLGVPGSTIGQSVAIRSFEGLRIYPKLKRQPGKERADVLSPTSTKDETHGFWGSIKSRLTGVKQEHMEIQKAHADINIFSVASGHLYERFLGIMILSVLKHTKSTVKFWFIENFLSPSFKDFLPIMAKEFGFDYQLVTYKWPSWLRAQTEKQRTIWGYKILFLDVLFPLDLDKVIFVDADQIVRTDLQELMDMDLKGAPYGYTPFCNDRKEMDGFRFWKHGYWQQHLAGKPYHISALYVVDLVRFRQMAAGDRLRGQYQALSADAGSLANLDQDLPNNMQHQVPIFSLPQEWLWCETWCSDEALTIARTIDLCNNPLTKEPKLDRARRQIPEWESYDQQVASLRSPHRIKDEL